MKEINPTPVLYAYYFVDLPTLREGILCPHHEKGFIIYQSLETNIYGKKKIEVEISRDKINGLENRIIALGELKTKIEKAREIKKDGKPGRLHLFNNFYGASPFTARADSGLIPRLEIPRYFAKQLYATIEREAETIGKEIITYAFRQLQPTNREINRVNTIQLEEQFQEDYDETFREDDNDDDDDDEWGDDNDDDDDGDGNLGGGGESNYEKEKEETKKSQNRWDPINRIYTIKRDEFWRKRKE